MKVKIVSDGTATGTKVMTEDDKIIEGVTHVVWRHDVSGIPEVELRIRLLSLAELTGELVVDD